MRPTGQLMSQRTARVPDGSRRVDIVPRPPSLTRDVRLDIAIAGKVRVRDARRSAIRVLNVANLDSRPRKKIKRRSLRATPTRCSTTRSPGPRLITHDSSISFSRTGRDRRRGRGETRETGRQEPAEGGVRTHSGPRDAESRARRDRGLGSGRDTKVKAADSRFTSRVSRVGETMCTRAGARAKRLFRSKTPFSIFDVIYMLLAPWPCACRAAARGRRGCCLESGSGSEDR